MRILILSLYATLVVGCYADNSSEIDIYQICKRDHDSKEVMHCIDSKRDCLIDVGSYRYHVDDGKISLIKKKLSQEATLFGEQINSGGLKDIAGKLNESSALSSKKIEYSERDIEFDIEEHIFIDDYVECKNGDVYDIYLFNGLDNIRYISVSSVPFI